MKFTKLSLAALVAMGIASSASAVENVKVSGQVKLWYQTMETNKGDLAAEQTSADGITTTANDGLFKKEGATGDLYAELKATGDLTKKVGFGLTFNMLTTAGLEKNLVNNVAAGAAASNATDGTDKNPYWLGEAYFTYKAGKTIAKIGRQELDTPLAYTEKWNAAYNTFEAAVLVNQDLPGTTLVGALVSRGNGADDILNAKTTYSGKVGVPGAAGTANSKTVTGNGQFYSFGTQLTHTGGSDLATVHDEAQGAWVLGAVTTLIPMTTAQAWFYNIEGSAQAYWLQADAKLPMNVGVGAQYAYLAAVGSVKEAISASATNDYKTDAYAVQATYSIAGVDLAAAYSSVSKGTLAAANVATAGKKTKLYTASILADGTLAALPGVNSWKLSANTKLAGFDLAASYGHYDAKENEKGFLFNRTASQTFKSSEIDLSVGTKIDEVNVVAYYLNQQDFNVGKQDRQAVRVIASINF